MTSSARHGRWAAGAVAAALGLLLAACGGAASALAPSELLQAKQSSSTVELRLDAGRTSAYGGFNFDGYGDGAMTVRVPVGWTVNVTCENASTTLTASCAVVQDRRLTPTAAPLAFVGASTPQPHAGLGLRDSAHFSFVASRAGRYRIACLVDGYELDGMWDWLVVGGAREPSVRT